MANFTEYIRNKLMSTRMLISLFHLYILILIENFAEQMKSKLLAAFREKVHIKFSYDVRKRGGGHRDSDLSG